MDGAAAAAQSLVSNVGQLVGKEFKQLRGVGVEVSQLRNELATINALLRMHSEADEGGVNHFVREWMKQLREVAYDAEDCVDLYLFRVRSRSGDSLFVWSKRLLTTLLSRRRLAGDITALRALASSINEQHGQYGVSLEPLSSSTDASSRPVAASASAAAARALHPAGSDQFVVNKDQATALADKVKKLRNGEEQLKVFSIVGFGGLGKTTLAVEVCRQLETEFERQAQVSVSQTFSGAKDLQGLLRRVLRQIAQPTSTDQVVVNIDTTTDHIDAMHVDDLERDIKQRLHNKRYLILIDDVWSIPAWDAIRSKLPSSNCGSRIIVTTRIDTVAKACSDANDDYIHHMKKLEDEESEKLFVSKAFGSGNSCPKDLKDAMGIILKKCGGLPLAIVSIASLLASYKPPEGKEMWETVQRSIGSQMENNPTLEGMRQILTLSYNHLPHHLKACIMYLSIFAEDYMIVKDQLLKRWIAEGLVAEKRGLTQMELAEGYFNELVSRNMIDRVTSQGTLRDGIREERCRVHDMMLEILVSKSLEANFVSLVGGQHEGMSYTNTIRRLSVHGGVEAHKGGSSSSKNVAARRGTGNGIKGMVMQHVRSLSVCDPEAHGLLGRLGEFTLLRVLDLEGCKGLTRKHMNCICRMYLLRFLSLKGTDVKVMPSRVGDLEHLQTLDVRQTQLKDLPKTVKKLEKLEHLLFSGKGGCGWMMPQGINKMKALRQVNKAAVVYDHKVAEEIGELDQLQELAINVDTGKEMNPEVVEKLACSLSKMYSLRWLEIGNFDCGKWPFDPIMEFLHGVQSSPRLLRYFKIYGRIDRLPDWVESLTDLVELDIGWTYLNGVQLFNVLCKLPRLKRLSLGPYFIRHGQDMVARSTQCFKELKELTLGYSPEVPPVYRFEAGSMSNLEMLTVYFGDQMKKIVGIEHLTNLKEVQFHGYREKMKYGLELVEELNNRNVTVRVKYEDS
ncbi:hypothetical protein E2562_026773 [Oryza meyeriana var. granulata]|uniref:Uncharacterized protein n=1 Tax=Oryza meyeriana var. granulata TaxID=110450 RepID=A0A6G1C927_9ORYZ|nr:hypothetical protein E2562_026773 [Oryza meyeriana var. granulata]